MCECIHTCFRACVSELRKRARGREGECISSSRWIPSMLNVCLSVYVSLYNVCLCEYVCVCASNASNGLKPVKMSCVCNRELFECS
jgi:hypothetical protein